MIALVLMLVVLLPAVPGSPAMSRPSAVIPEQPSADRVLIVSYPRLTWELVDEHRPPELLALAARGATASTSVRTIGERTTLAEGYATIGAGARAGVEEPTAGLAFLPDDPFEGGAARHAYARRTGAPATGKVLHLGIVAVRERNAGRLYDASPGLLGASLEAAGRRAAVIAVADHGYPGGDHTLVHREAALAVMDRVGRVPGGVVGESLLEDDPAAAFGVRVAPSRAMDSFDAAWRDHDVVLVEMSDLERADAYEAFATAAAGRAGVGRALADADKLLGRLIAQVDLERDLVIVISPAAPRAQEELTVAVMAGVGVEPGRAHSATTRRPGLVTLPDVAPTVLRALGLDRPHDMVGSPITSTGSGPVRRDDAGDLSEDSHRAVFRDGAVTPIAGAFVAFQLLTYALAAIAIARRLPRFRGVAGFFALVALAYPPFVFLSALVPYEDLTVVGYMASLFACAAGMAWLARAGARRASLSPPLLLIGLTVSVLVLDVLTGGHLQLNTVFGYSPIVAGRFNGFGNQSFALVSMGAIVLATGAWGTLSRRGHGGGALAVAGSVLAVVIVADGHPSLGADVGGVLALVPAAAVVMLLLGGTRLRVRNWPLLCALTLVVLSSFALIDVASPQESQTHLGRLIERLSDDGGGGELLTVIRRKAMANLRILVSSIWSLIIVIACAFFAFLTLRAPPTLRTLQEAVPGLRACLIGGLVAGALGFAANDSGVAIPAVMLSVALPYITYLAVTASPPGRRAAFDPPVGGRTERM